ncbi:Rpn family recombination-promoting nuclease/putative transposase [Oceanobacillus jeddahense]|uniref:Rpn family recombination-promoting nuclease/putative transposase n=1 Tax=Oceanobacillus jeddahense TaxID=1462527 RepID=UPI0005962F5F|nr:Rpn family recombination-promoting nuclease/putative transposase [Oceanobacillus jeddahense]
MQIQSPHDKIFKETFSNVDVAKDFITHFLPPSIRNTIDVDSIQPQKDSFISHNLQEYFSDLLFQTKIHQKPAYVYFLFEHKSYHDYYTALQLLRYMVEIWETKRDNTEENKQPIIVPIVLYHGDTDWYAGTSFHYMLEGYKSLPPDLHKYVPNYEFFLYDVSDFKDEDVQLNVFLRIILLVFRDIRKNDIQVVLNTIYLAIDYLRQMKDQRTATEYLETLFYYIFRVQHHLTKKQYCDIMKHIENTYQEGSELAMTLAEIFRNEGKEEGRVEGKAEGIAEALANTAIRLITKFVAPPSEDIKKKIYEQEISTLETIIDHIDELETIEDVKQYLK